MVQIGSTIFRSECVTTLRTESSADAVLSKVGLMTAATARALSKRRTELFMIKPPSLETAGLCDRRLIRFDIIDCVFNLSVVQSCGEWTSLQGVAPCERDDEETPCLLYAAR